MKSWGGVSRALGGQIISRFYNAVICIYSLIYMEVKTKENGTCSILSSAPSHVEKWLQNVKGYCGDPAKGKLISCLSMSGVRDFQNRAYSSSRRIFRHVSGGWTFFPLLLLRRLYRETKFLLPYRGTWLIHALPLFVCVGSLKIHRWSNNCLLFPT